MKTILYGYLYTLSKKAKSYINKKTENRPTLKFDRPFALAFVTSSTSRNREDRKYENYFLAEL